jgi:hypothetical protein
MAKPKPLVQVATCCENILTESDRVNSIIRVVDTFYLTRPENLPQGVEPVLQFKAFLSLKSGDVTGEYDIDIVLRSPSGKRAPLPEKWHVSFLGKESGATLTMNLSMPVREWGLYWYDVIWEGEVLTSIPLKLVEGEKPGQVQDEARQKAVLG